MTRRTNELIRRKPEVLVWLILGYFLLCVILRVVRSDSLQNDEAEQALFSQIWLWGYGRQPPLYDWLQIGANSIFGLSLLSLSLLKNTILFLCCLFYAMAAKQVMSDRHLPYLAMTGLLAVPSISLLSQRDLTHAVSTLLFVSLFMLVFFRTLMKGSLFSYLLLGGVVGLGVLTKYNFVIIPIAALGALLLDAEWRNRLLDWRIVAAMLISGIIVAPHALWVIGHLGEATSGTLEAMREGASSDPLRNIARGVFSMTVSFMKGTVPVILIFTAVFHRHIKQIWQASDRWTRLVGWMILFSLLLILLIGLGFEASNIRQKWLSPFQMLVPLYLALKLSAARIDCREALVKIAPALLAVVTVTAIGLAVSNLIGPYFGHYSKEHTPYSAMLQEVVGQHGTEPTYILTDDLMMAGNARVNLPSTPVIMPEFQAHTLKELSGDDEGLVVWPLRDNAEDGVPEALVQTLRENGLSEAMTSTAYIDVPFNFAQNGETMRFGYFWLPRASEK